MSFFDSITKIAGSLLADKSPQEVAGALSDHVSSMDPSELSGHMQQSVEAMDPQHRQQLGQQLLQTFTDHPASQDDGPSAAEQAGTNAQEVQQGSPGGLRALIAYAQANPQVLQTAVSAFVERNPGALAQLSPGLLQQFASKFTGS
jgi:hypothetical protein